MKINNCSSLHAQGREGGGYREARVRYTLCREMFPPAIECTCDHSDEEMDREHERYYLKMAKFREKIII